jgi:ABC-type transport system involved in cytochrome bd biosynthesis fused ATPase/permease subunit
LNICRRTGTVGSSANGPSFQVEGAESDGSVLGELQAGAGLDRSRLIVFSGPTGCGKSTTIYSILNEFDPLQHNIQTAESPIEVVMPHVNQVEISDFGRNTFLNWVRGIVREAPDDGIANRKEVNVYDIFVI